MKKVWMNLAGGFYMDAYIIEKNEEVMVIGFGSCGLSVWKIKRNELNEKLEILNEKLTKEGFDKNNIEDLPWILLEYCYEEFENNYDFFTKYDKYGNEDCCEYDFYKLKEFEKEEIINSYK